MERAVSNQAEIANDSVRALAEAAAEGHRVAVKGKGPARPFLAGVGLDRPFFDDKNRAFWVLQSTGWTGPWQTRRKWRATAFARSRRLRPKVIGSR
jgi:hypothetical protein